MKSGRNTAWSRCRFGCIDRESRSSAHLLKEPLPLEVSRPSFQAPTIDLGSGRTHEGAVQEIPRKEVIQPHLPVRLPCYDFVPVANPTFDGCLLAVGPPASGVTDSHDVTGGVYKAREHIHRGVMTRGY